MFDSLLFIVTREGTAEGLIIEHHQLIKVFALQGHCLVMDTLRRYRPWIAAFSDRRGLGCKDFEHQWTEGFRTMIKRCRHVAPTVCEGGAGWSHPNLNLLNRVLPGDQQLQA